MSINLKELADLKDRIAKDERAKQKAEGRLEELMSRLRKEHGCKTFEEAERKVKELSKREAALTKEFEREMAKLQKEMSQHEGEDDDD